MNFYKHWIHFQKTDRDFLDLSYKKQKLISEMNNLNERRKVIQTEILKLTSIVDTCKNCTISCCVGNYNHYFIVDFVIRLFSENPIEEFNYVSRKQPSLIKMLYFKIKNKELEPFLSSHLRTNCPDLTFNGCAHLPADRPIRCILYTCRTLRKSLPQDSISRIGILSEELVVISEKAFNIFSL